MITGTVETKDKAGQTEAALLAARAVKLAVKKIGEELPGVPGKKPTLLLFSNADVPTFDALIAFRIDKTLLKDALAEAEAVSARAMQKAPVITESPFAALGLGLDAASKILGHFRSDYAIGGLSLSYEDSLLIHALAGDSSLLDKYTVRLPAQLIHH